MAAQKDGFAVAPAAKQGKLVDDKENIDPFHEQPGSGLPAAGLFGMPPAKQPFARANSSGKQGRMPLADITALCMLQAGLPPKQQQQAGTSAAQKGLWGPGHGADKLGASQVTSGGPPASSGHRLAAMR